MARSMTIEACLSEKSFYFIFTAFRDDEMQRIDKAAPAIAQLLDCRNDDIVYDEFGCFYIFFRPIPFFLNGIEQFQVFRGKLH